MHELGDACVAPITPSFDLSAFLSNTFKIGSDVEYLSGLANLPTTSEDAQVSPLSLSDSAIRKRRRTEVANPANTLDGLVARRADDGREPFTKRYLSEQEAIEGPDDEIEIKRMEKDPDVSTRTCSECGYKGKWISEMIRHKRVHTSERPFKCRYCSRTSKWKADLIRHVAKTHGIRVVSKYSRSKTFDPQSTVLANRSEEDKPKVFACEPDREPLRQRQDSLSPPLHRPQPLSPSRAPLSYRCVRCLFEQDGLSVMLNHLRNAHNCSPYECSCGVSFDSIDAAMSHSKRDATCTSNDLTVNITTIYTRNKLLPPSIGSMDSLSPSSRGDSSPEYIASSQETEEDSICGTCPYRNTNEAEMRRHREGHAGRRDAALKCLFCPWSSSHRGEMESHLRLHTLYPQQFMAAVERGSLTTPLVSPLPQMADMQQSMFPSGSQIDLAAALLALQSRSYLASMSCLLSMAPSAFTPVTPPALATPTLLKCSRCEARFRDSSALAAHSQLHGSGLPRACSRCDYATSRATNYLRHVQTHHSNGSLNIVESLPEEAEPVDDVVDVEM